MLYILGTWLVDLGQREVTINHYWELSDVPIASHCVRVGQLNGSCDL